MFMMYSHGFTWHSNISQHSLLAVFDAADLGEVDVQTQEGHAAEKGHGAHKDAIVAGVLVVVKDAVLLHLFGAVNVAFIGDAAENDDGEELDERTKEKKVEMWDTQVDFVRDLVITQ